MKRRKLLQAASLLTGGMLVAVGFNSWIARSVAQTKRSKRLIVVFLRGGIDGLNMVVPHQEIDYYQARPTIAVPYPQESDGAMDLDGFFGLHPSLKDIFPFWQQKNLAVIHNCGSPDATRSHFDAQDYMENGTPGVKSTADGWLNRLLAQLPPEKLTQALNVGNTTPRILRGEMPVSHLRPGKNSTNPLPIDRPQVNQAFNSLYGGQDLLSKAYQEGLKAREMILAELRQEMISASRGASSVANFVDDAQEVAKLIKGDTKTQLAFMDIGGWDTHINQQRILENLLPPLGEGLATLVKGLGSLYSDTVIVVMSEFGRTVEENGNQGTDHGHGNIMLLLGGAVNGGKVYGEWQGLTESALYEGRDLPITTDFREAIACILTQHLSISTASLAPILPGYQAVNNLNLFG
ncbi:MAG: DUF1501 domain-containing protein [Pleurocapsa sp.]